MKGYGKAKRIEERKEEGEKGEAVGGDEEEADKCADTTTGT